MHIEQKISDTMAEQPQKEKQILVCSDPGNAAEFTPRRNFWSQFYTGFGLAGGTRYRSKSASLSSYAATSTCPKAWPTARA